MEISCAIFLLLLFGPIHITVGRDALTQRASPRVQQLMLCIRSVWFCGPLCRLTQASWWDRYRTRQKLPGTSLESDGFLDKSPRILMASVMRLTQTSVRKLTPPLSERHSKAMCGHFQPTVTSFPQIMASGFSKHLKLPLSRNALQVGTTSSGIVRSSKPSQLRAAYAIKPVLRLPGSKPLSSEESLHCLIF